MKTITLFYKIVCTIPYFEKNYISQISTLRLYCQLVLPIMSTKAGHMHSQSHDWVNGDHKHLHYFGENIEKRKRDCIAIQAKFISNYIYIDVQRYPRHIFPCTSTGNILSYMYCLLTPQSTSIC